MSSNAKTAGINFIKYCQDGDVENVKKCLERKEVSITLRDKYDTPLRSAADNNRLKVGELLLEYGFSPNFPHKSPEDTPLVRAAYYGHLDFCKLLFRQKIKKTIINEALLYAIDGLRWEICSYLLQQGADPNTRNLHFDPLLVVAIREENYDMIEESLAYGADPDTVYDIYLQTSCLLVSPDEKTTSLLLEYGADPNNVGKSKFYPLIKAVRYGDIKTCQMLIEAGAKINVTGYYGETPLRLAAKMGRIEFAKYLLKMGADIHYGKGVVFNRKHLKSDSELVELLGERNYTFPKGFRITKKQ